MKPIDLDTLLLKIVVKLFLLQEGWGGGLGIKFLGFESHIGKHMHTDSVFQ